MTGPSTVAQPIAAIDVKKTLQCLARELEAASVARPPSDAALDRWQEQAESLRGALDSTTLPGRNNLVRAVMRFLEDLNSVRDRKARYLAHREAAQDTARFAADTSGVGSERVQIPKRALAESIQIGLKTLTGAKVDRTASSAKRPAEEDARLTPVSREDFSSTTGVDEAGAGLPFPSTDGVSSVSVVAIQENSTGSDIVTQRVLDRSAVPSGNRFRNDKDTATARLSRRVDAIMAVVGRLARPGSFAEARDIALAWLTKKGFNLPSDPQEAFEICTSKGNTAASVVLSDRGVWALQAETADLSVVGRRWRVEMVLLDVRPTPAVSVTLTAISPSDAPQPPASVPQLVSQLVEGIGLLDADDGSRLDAGPTHVEDHDGLQRLLDSLRSPLRTRPVLVLPTYRKDDHHKQLLDPIALSHKLGGLARVFVLQRDMVWAFNEAVGPRASVAGASVRLYQPCFSDEDPPGRHPFWSPAELNSQGLSLKNLSGRLLDEAAYLSLRAIEREEVIPPFESVRALVLRGQIEEARRKAEAAAQQPETEGNLAALRDQLTSEVQLRMLFEDDNRILADDLRRVRTERTELKDQRDTLRGRVVYLENRVKELLEKLREARGPAEPAFPDNWDELEQWCEEHLSSHVVLTPKALRHARSSQYLNISFVYRVLWFLAEQYVPARRNGGEGYKAGLAAMGLEISPVGRSAQERSSKETYKTVYKGKRVALDWHVKGSDDRDPRYGFRIYFHWEPVDGCMVVGSLPEHLDNHLS